MKSAFDWVCELRSYSHLHPNTLRDEMLACYDQASRIADSDSDEAIFLLQRSREIAESLHEPWWAMLCRQVTAHIQIVVKNDLHTGIREASFNVIELRKSLYNQMPQRVCAHEDLVDAHIRLDPIGYQEEILAALEFIERESCELRECRMCHIEKRSNFLQVIESPELLPLACQQLQMAEQTGGDSYLSAAYSLLCRALYHFDREQAIRDLDAMAQLAFEKGQNSKRKWIVARALMWRAVAARLVGNEEKSQDFYQQSFCVAHGLARAPEQVVISALLAFYTEGKEWEKLIELYSTHGEDSAQKRHFFDAADNFFHCCEVLARCGQSWNEMAAKTRTANENLKKPAYFEEKLAKLEAETG